MASQGIKMTAAGRALGCASVIDFLACHTLGEVGSFGIPRRMNAQGRSRSYADRVQEALRALMKYGVAMSSIPGTAPAVCRNDPRKPIQSLRPSSRGHLDHE